MIRKRYGKMIVNTWLWGGANQYRGWRPFNCKEGAELSQHKFGRAIDLNPVELLASDIRIDIKAKKYSYDFRFITCIEDNVNWLHIDCRNTDRLLIIVP